MYANPTADVADFDAKKQELQEFIMKYSTMGSSEQQPNMSSVPEKESQYEEPSIEEID
jgi:hypothetical protein